MKTRRNRDADRWIFVSVLTDLEVSRICTALIRTGSDEDLTLATRIITEHAEYTERKLEGK